MDSHKNFKFVASILVIMDFLLGFQFLGYPLYMYLLGITPYEIGTIYSLEFISKIIFTPILHFFKGRERLSYALSFVLSSIVFLNLAFYPSFLTFLVNAFLIGLSNALGSSVTVFMGDFDRSKFPILGFLRRIFAALGFLTFYFTKMVSFSLFYFSFCLIAIIPAILSKFIILKPVSTRYNLSLSFIGGVLREFSWYLIYAAAISLFSNMLPIMIHYYTGISVYDEVFYFILIFTVSSIGAYVSKAVKGKLLIMCFVTSLLILIFMGTEYQAYITYVIYSFFSATVSPNFSYLYAKSINKNIDKIVIISLVSTLITALDNFVEGILITFNLTPFIFPLASLLIFLGLFSKVKELSLET
ncbi:hypothetical protein EWF20_07045 [Sulfolobus sp. S-194]|uniref:hypothetical protein n=1 Tax=Sulfolobus sp. S-194 TaxID=2512240 RepID=UPI0014373D40|nr:hypothetical protein [Sulfolobus sp. S-194]QIW23930.1 hypothetical protein EWF20_07045 [Sulfolobus sp. S-194]